MNKKYLYLLRHAKSSWTDTELSDHERTLNDRGIRDAPEMGLRLKQKSPLPELILCSDATRALLTARFVATEIGYDRKEITYIPSIYESSVENLRAIVSQQRDQYNTILLVGHNPAITELVNDWCNENFVNVPTCGLVLIEFDVDHWKLTLDIKGKVMDFDYPKKKN